jgi:beta-barrel assembly-enhancing protease
VRDPSFNASMAPNGMMIVHTGLLARMRNEAQLAAVLGHEAGHYLRRHSVQNWRSLKTKSALTAVVGLAGAAATGATGNNWFDLANAINNALVLSLFSYNRQLESEADAYGLKLLSNAQYPPRAAARVWSQLIEERKASAATRGKRYRDHMKSAFSTHPPSDVRMADLEQSAKQMERNIPGPYDERRASWLAAMSEIRSDLLAEQIKLNDPGASLYLLRSLGEDGWDSLLRYYEGEAYRLRDESGDAERAAEAYAAAVRFPDVLPEAHRQHGYALLKTGRSEEGRLELKRYLELRPQAADAAMVHFSLSQ